MKALHYVIKVLIIEKTMTRYIVFPLFKIYFLFCNNFTYNLFWNNFSLEIILDLHKHCKDTTELVPWPNFLC